MIVSIIGFALVGLGIFLYFNRQHALNKVMNVKYHQTTTIQDAMEIYNAVKAQLGAGNYSAGIVELKGVCFCDEPLKAEHSGKKVVYYHATVQRKYEVTEQERDSEGRTRTVTNTRTDTVSSNTRSVPFILNDGSGDQITVFPEGASIDAIETFDRFDPEPPQGFNLNFSNMGNSRTLGYTYSESSIPVSSHLYILGEISDKRGTVGVIKPSKEGESFIISTKSEEEIIASAESSASWQLYGGIASAVIGLLMAVGGFFIK